MFLQVIGWSVELIEFDLCFCRVFQSLSAPPESTDVNDDSLIYLVSSDLRESVHQLRDKLEDFCKEELKKISDRGKVLDIHLLSETSPSSSHIMENIILEMC